MTNKKPAPKKTTALRKQAGWAKPKVQDLRLFVEAADEAAAYTGYLFYTGYRDRPFYDKNGARFEGFEACTMDAEYADGFRDGIRYAMTGEESAAVPSIRTRIATVLWHKSVAGNVTFLDDTDPTPASGVARAKRRWFRRS